MNKFFFILLVLSSFINAQPTIVWAKQLGGSGQDIGSFISTDPLGNTYLIGTYSDSINVGNNLYSGNNQFLVKYNPTGVLQWSILLKNISISKTCSDAQNFYLCGAFSYTATIGDSILVSAGEQDALVVRISASGTINMVKRSFSTGQEWARGMDVDQYGNIYITGMYDTLSMFDQHLLTGTSSQNFFLIKYDSSGNIVWSRTGTQKYRTIFGDLISVNNNGTIIYTMGMASGENGGPADSVEFSNSSIHYKINSFYIYFATKYDGAGNLIHVKDISQVPKTHLTDLDLDGYGNVYLSIFNNYSPFEIKKYDSLLNLQWTVSDPVGGSLLGSSPTIPDIEVDPAGNVYATGSVYGPCSFSGLSLSDSSQSFGYLVKYANTGSMSWATTIAHNGSSYGMGLSSDGFGNIYTTGYFYDTVVTGTGSLNSKGQSDIYVIKLNENNLILNLTKQSLDTTIKVYPNPSLGTIFINCKNIRAVRIKNMVGKDIEMNKTSITGSEMSIDLTNQPAGIYMLEITSENEKSVKKIVIH